MFTVFDVANWFLKKEPMTHKKLQKLCYYAQAWNYTLYNRPLFLEQFEAWVHGPVCKTLYDYYRDKSFELIYPEKEPPTFDLNSRQLLEDVWETYGDYTANALEVLTHSEPPWQKARIGYEPSQNCNVIIKPQDMRNYYQTIYIGGDA